MGAIPPMLCRTRRQDRGLTNKSFSFLGTLQFEKCNQCRSNLKRLFSPVAPWRDGERHLGRENANRPLLKWIDVRNFHGAQ